MPLSFRIFVEYLPLDKVHPRAPLGSILQTQPLWSSEQFQTETHFPIKLE